MTGYVSEIKGNVPRYFRAVHSVKSRSTFAHTECQPKVLNPTKGMNMWIQMQAKLHYKRTCCNTFQMCNA